ncbi:MAG: ACT domain-containing protein, partial [Archaeoglobaceae archaeon]
DIVAFAKGLPAKNAVNLPPIEPAEFEFLLPYATLAEKMGRIAYARLDGIIKKVRITFSGKIAEKNTEFVIRALLKGLLERTLGMGINLVSAKTIAEDRGIKVESSTSTKSEHYENLLEIEVESDRGKMYFAGTCFGKEFRILKIDAYHVNFVPKGHYIISLHEDKPGVIGRVGTLFGKNNINIAGMIVGRSGDKPGGVQLMLLLVDDPPSEEVLREMTKLDGIIDATYVEL